jgi:type VI secretion system protein ImpA
MTTELETLLAPISSDNFRGADLSFSAEFDRIAEARREDDASLQQGDWVSVLKVADWAEVESLCRRLLIEQSKDLRLALWYMEARAKRGGIEGLADGFRLLLRLLKDAWPSLYPGQTQIDSEEAGGVVSWGLTRASQILRELPLLDSRHGTLSFLDYQRSRRLGQDVIRNPDRADGPEVDAITPEMWDQALRTSGAAAIEVLKRKLDLLVALVDELLPLIEERLGEQAPSFAHFRGSVGDLTELVSRMCAQRGIGDTNVPEEAAEAPSVSSADSVGAATCGQIRTRGQAKEHLQQVAAFFRRTEPHNPAAYLIEKAIVWSELPLHEWLRQVIRDDISLSHVDELLGMAAARRDEAG